MTWIQTYTGQRLDLLLPDPSHVCLEDIAQPLSLLVRFTGQIRHGYTVAQHSVLVARALRDEGHSLGVQRAGLMHDAHEAYTGDVSAPIKGVVGAAWSDFERRMELAVRQRFSVPRDLPAAVRSMDLRMLLAEARDLLAAPPAPWGIPSEPWEGRISRVWSAREARGEFLEECYRLEVV
jgi:uncharacterized protein